MSSVDWQCNEEYLDQSLAQTAEVRGRVFVGCSRDSFADAVQHAWEAAKAISERDGVSPPTRLDTLTEGVLTENPITWYIVVTIGTP